MCRILTLEKVRRIILLFNNITCFPYKNNSSAVRMHFGSVFARLITLKVTDLNFKLIVLPYHQYDK